MGQRDAEAPQASGSERAWLAVYGVAASIYRVLVTVFIALFIASRFFVIGVLLAAWALVAMAVVPIVRGVRHLAGSPRLRRHRRRAILVTLGSVAALLVLLLAVPMPYHSHAEGVVWMPEQAMVRTGANSFVGGFLAQPGTRVAEGDPLVRCYDPMLEAKLRYSEARVDELQAEYASQFVADRVKAEIAREQLAGAQAALKRASEQAAELIVRAHSDGVFVVPQAVDVPGRYFRKGELLGYVIGRVKPIARVVVPQDAVDLVRLATDRIRLRAVNRLDVVADGSIVRQVPAGEAFLPSRALAVDGGGQIATDPRESKGPKALERMFQFDVAFKGASRFDLFGERVYVRFDHQMEPLAMQWYRTVRLLFLSRFSV